MSLARRDDPTHSGFAAELARAPSTTAGMRTRGSSSSAGNGRI
jgi:hypothetical protein